MKPAHYIGIPSSVRELVQGARPAEVAEKILGGGG